MYFGDPTIRTACTYMRIETEGERKEGETEAWRKRVTDISGERGTEERRQRQTHSQ